MKTQTRRLKSGKGKVELQSRVAEVKPESDAALAHVKADSQPVPVSTEVLEYAPPEDVAEAARAVANPRLVEDYDEAIAILRDEKRFTFREIAEWLTTRFGIETDHNAVYRVYTKGTSKDEAAWAAHESAQDEQDSTEG